MGAFCGKDAQGSYRPTVQSVRSISNSVEAGDVSKKKRKNKKDHGLSGNSSTNSLSSSNVATGTPSEMLQYLGTSNQKALKRLFHDLQEMIAEPKDVGFCCPRSKHDLWTWEGWLRGPEDTPYELGQFKLMFSFDDRFPHKPPRVTFQDPVPFHPNIDSEAGKICVDMLHDAGWSPLYKMRHVIMGLSSLLSEPNPQDPLNTKAAAYFLNDFIFILS